MGGAHSLGQPVSRLRHYRRWTFARPRATSQLMIRALMLAVLGAAAFAAVYLLAAPDQPATVEAAPEPSITSTEAASIESVAPEALTFELRPGAEAVPHSEEASHAVRDVTPDYMTAGPKVTGTLARVVPPVEPSKARTERFFNAIVVSAGMIKVLGQEIHLAGIAAPEFDARCGEGPASWPCGRMARAALRGLLRGRAVECEIPAGADALPDPANCLVGGENISEWLVAQGWAKRSGEDFGAAEDSARQAKLGLWSDKRPDDQPSDVATSG